MHTGIGHVNLYNVYGQCISGREAASTAAATTHKIPYAHNFLGSSLPRVGGPDACIDSIAGSAYFNQARRAQRRLQPRPPSRLRPLLSLRLTCPIGASVQPAVLAAAHVKKQPFPWSTCGNQIHYTSTRKNLPRDTYPKFFGRIRVVIYNGDWDACVPYTDAEAWTESLGLAVETPWHPWKYRNGTQVAGYAITYAKNFSFITVKGGRHEVPETAPEQALEMVRRLISGVEF